MTLTHILVEHISVTPPHAEVTFKILEHNRIIKTQVHLSHVPMDRAIYHAQYTNSQYTIIDPGPLNGLNLYNR
jgi:hypothetical protein